MGISGHWEWDPVTVLIYNNIASLLVSQHGVISVVAINACN